MKILRDFIRTKSTGIYRYLFEQTLFLFLQMLPGIFGLTLRGIFYKIIIRSTGVFGIEENVQISHSANLILGKNVFIGRNSYLGASDGGIVLDDNVCILDSCYLNVFNYNELKDENRKIIIGPNVVLSHGCTIHGHSGVQIGKNTIIGPNTVIISASHGCISRETVYRNTKIDFSDPISIGENVWIGAGVYILAGISIGKNSVIGAGAIVTNDIPEYSVYAGNPAKIIRKID